MSFPYKSLIYKILLIINVLILSVGLHELNYYLLIISLINMSYCGFKILQDEDQEEI